FFFFFQAEDGIRDLTVTGVQTCALPILFAKAFVSDSHRISLATTNSRRDQNARANRTAHRHYRLSMWFPISLPFFSPYPAGNRLYSARDPPSLLAAEHGGKVSAFPGASTISITSPKPPQDAPGLSHGEECGVP